MSALLMDVFTRIIKAWHISQHLNAISDAETAYRQALCHSVPEIHHSDQGVQYLSNAYIYLRHHELNFIARRGCPWENVERLSVASNAGRPWEKLDFIAV